MAISKTIEKTRAATRSLNPSKHEEIVFMEAESRTSYGGCAATIGGRPRSIYAFYWFGISSSSSNDTTFLALSFTGGITTLFSPTKKS